MDQCLASLEVLNYPNYEVIVVNDGSNDGTLAISERLSLLQDHQPGEQGASASPRNVGGRGGDRRDRRLYRQRLASPIPIG